MLVVIDRSLSCPTTPTVILQKNAVRLYATFVNEGGTAIHLTLGGLTPTTTSGIYLAPSGGSYVMDAWTPWVEEVRAIATTVPSQLSILEVSHG